MAEADYKKLDTGESWDESDRELTQLGYFSWRPRFLEPFNKPAIFAGVFAFGNLFMVMSYGIISLVIPIIESVFNLNSKQTGVIFMANDISGTIVALMIANYCSARKVRWIGVGMLVVFLSAVIPSSTTLFAEYPQPYNDTELDGAVLAVVAENSSNTDIGSLPDVQRKTISRGLCNETRHNLGGDVAVGKSSGSFEEEYALNNHKYYFMFVLGSVLQGIGNAFPRVAGATYMDEIFTQKQFGIAISFLYVVTFFGYPAAMITGGYFLQYYVTLNPPPGVTTASKEWVGAWWMGMFFPSILVFIFSFLVLLFPRQMPAASKVLQEKVKRGITTAQEKRTELNRSLGEITRDMFPALKRLIKNQALNCLIVGDIFLFISVGAYSYYPKLYAKIFRLDYKSVGRVMGIANIIGFGTGLVGSGLLMRLKQWDPKDLQLVYAIISALAIPFTMGSLHYCPTDTHAGVEVSYEQVLGASYNATSLPTLIGECNKGCGCTTAFYTPVCDGNITYFSPCHAGCSEVVMDENNTLIGYDYCTCTASRTALPGVCGTTCPTTLWTSLAITTTGTIVGFAGFAAHAYIYQRVVSEVDRTLAQGVRSSVTRALGTLPAPIIFGWVIDKFCTVWRVSENGTQGNCWLYDIDSLMWWFIMLRVAMRTLSASCYFICWWIYPESNKKGEETDEKGDRDATKYQEERKLT